MGTISYHFEKTDPSTYRLSVKNERVLLDDQFLTSQFTTPLLDLLLSFQGQNLHDLLLKCVVNNLNLIEIIDKKKEIESFFSLFSFYLNVYTNNSVKTIEYDPYSWILEITKSEYCKKCLSNSKWYIECHERLPLLNNTYFTTTYSDWGSKIGLDFEKEYDEFYKNYLRSKIQEHNSFEINIKISDSNILRILTRDMVRKIELEINNSILCDCEVLIKEYHSQFNEFKTRFYELCLNPSKEKQLENQFMEIQKTQISDNELPRINNILEKNPDLSKPNLIRQSGKNLIHYLSYFYFLKRNNPCINNETLQFYNRFGDFILNINENIFNYKIDENHHINLYIFDDLKFDTRYNKYSFFSMISSVGIDGNILRKDIYPFLDINFPVVKEVHVINDLNEIYNSEIVIELRNINEENPFDDTEEYVPIINEDYLPCLMSWTLFNKYNINGKMTYHKEDIVREIKQIIDPLKSITMEEIHKKYIEFYVVPEKSKYSEERSFTKDLKETKEKNEKRLGDFIFHISQPYLIHKLCHQYSKRILRTNKPDNQVIIHNTLQQENEELGRRTELIVYWFLQKYIEGDNWSMDDFSSYNVPECLIKWNNQIRESFIPFDFSIKLNNIEYKIEVKSTRGNEDSVFYLSIKEIEELLLDPKHYFLLRLSFIKKGVKVYGIQFNEEFYGSFFKMKHETIKIVKEKLIEWKEYYKSKTIRFTLDQFEIVPDTYDKNLKPNLLREPTVYDSCYWTDYKYFVKKTYFSSSDDLDRILDSYSKFPEVSSLQTEYEDLKSDNKFQLFDND